MRYCMLALVLLSNVFAGQKIEIRNGSEIKPLMQDVIHLEKGYKVKGIIVSDSNASYIEILTPDKNRFKFSRWKINKISKEPVEDIDNLIGKKREYPALAFSLSFLFPGVGQYYNGEFHKGFLQEILIGGSFVLAFTKGMDTRVGMYPYYSSSREPNAIFWISMGTASGAYIWSMIDAVFSARSINLMRNSYAEHLIEFEKNGNLLGFDVGICNKGLGASLTYDF